MSESNPPRLAKSASPSATRPPRRVKKRVITVPRIMFLLLIFAVLAVAGSAFVPMTRYVTAYGYVMTDDEVELRPSVQGAIEDWLVSTSDTVEKGAVVIQLTDKPQQARLDRARSHLEEKRAELVRLDAQRELQARQRERQIEQAQKNLALLESHLEQIRVGYEAGSAYSRKELEEAQLKVDLARSQLDELLLDRGELTAREREVVRRQIEVAEKEVAAAEIDLEQRKVRATMAGKIYFNSFEPGEVVKPEHVLGQVFDPSEWVVKLKLSERDIRFVKVGQPVDVAIEAYPAYHFGYVQARVSRVYDVVTPQSTGSGIFYVEARIEDFGGLTPKPGMSVAVDIDTGQTTLMNWALGL